MPYSGAWCDRCFTIVRLTRPVGLWVFVYGFATIVLIMLATALQPGRN